MDGFFAATALAKDLTLVTRNVRILRHSACRCSTRGTNKWPTVKSRLTVPLATLKDVVGNARKSATWVGSRLDGAGISPFSQLNRYADRL